MSVYQADAQQVSGLWVRPEVETADQVVSLRASIALSEEAQLASEDVAATLVAGGQELTQTYGSGDRPLAHLSTGSVTAVAFFGWANPEGLTPEQVHVRVLDETATFDLDETGDPTDPGDLPVA